MAKFLGLFDSSFPRQPKSIRSQIFRVSRVGTQKKASPGGDAHYSSIPSVASALLRRDAAGDCCCSSNGTEERGGRPPPTHPKKGGKRPHAPFLLPHPAFGSTSDHYIKAEEASTDHQFSDSSLNNNYNHPNHPSKHKHEGEATVAKKPKSSNSWKSLMSLSESQL